MTTRPRIATRLLRTDRLIESSCYVLLIVLWCSALYGLLQLPAIIPTHFNAVGKADGYGNKWTLLMLPVIATVIYFAISYLNKFPHRFNYVVPIAEDNAARQYGLATRMLRFLKFAVLLTFTLLTVLTTLEATSLGAWFLPFTIALFIIPSAVLIIKSVKPGK